MCSGDITARKALTYSELIAAHLPAVPHTLLPAEFPLSGLHAALASGLTLPFVLKDDSGESELHMPHVTEY